MDLEELLLCPYSKNEVEISHDDTVYVKNSDRTYPIKNTIINFIPEINDEISNAYDKVSSVYNSMLTSSNIITKLYNSVVWGLNDQDYVDHVLSYIPDDFDRLILDVPVGSGVFTCEKYSNLKNAKIISIDYSYGMLMEAKKLYQMNNIQNVTLIRADVTNLPIKRSSIDLLLTMNGLHAFPDKIKAIEEITRVLKDNGDLIGCFYVKNKRKLSDLFINNVYVRQRSFTPPFYREEEFVKLLNENYKFIEKNNKKSIFYFYSRKK